jgi:excisionase family DNA binding protein
VDPGAAHAQLLADRLPARTELSDEEWLDADQAAAYLKIAKSSLYKLTAERQIAFEQARPGCKVYLKPRALDEYRTRGPLRKHARR